MTYFSKGKNGAGPNKSNPIVFSNSPRNMRIQVRSILSATYPQSGEDAA